MGYGKSDRNPIPCYETDSVFAAARYQISVSCGGEAVFRLGEGNLEARAILRKACAISSVLMLPSFYVVQHVDVRIYRSTEMTEMNSAIGGPTSSS